MSPAKKAGPLEAALIKAAAKSSWLEDSDKALLALATTYARRIDQGTQEFLDGDISSTDYNKVLYLGPHLLNTLKAAGMSPEDRMKILAASGPQVEVDPVDEIKERRRRRAAG